MVSKDGGTEASQPPAEATGDDIVATDSEIVEVGRSGSPRRRKFFAAGAVALVALGALGWFVGKPMLAPELEEVSGIVPTAPRLTAGAGEQLFRIDPEQSSATYEVQEQLAGASTSTAIGSTQAIAGDVVVNTEAPQKSRLGAVVIDVHQLRSDNALRDSRVQMSYLESHAYPLATFTPSKISGLPESLTNDRWYPVTLNGQLKVHDIAQPTEWKGKVRRSGDDLQAKVSTTVKMSQFEVGPISLVGLVRTKDEMKLSLNLVAVDPARQDTASVVGVPAPSGPEAVSETAGPSFRDEVAPILSASCASCHNLGKSGTSAMRMATAADARRFASGIALATQSRYMPPWLASDKNIPLQHDPRLSEKAIATLQRWADTGAELDVEPTTKILPTGTPPPNPRKDKVLPLTTPYVGDGSVSNDYRCFVLEPDFKVPSVVTGYTFVPDQEELLHHALIYRVSAAARNEASAREQEDDRPGWSCYGNTGLRSDVPSVSQRRSRNVALFAGWAPGQAPRQFRSGTGFRFDPGDFVVIQIHYHFHVGEPSPPDRSSVELEATAASPSIKEIFVANPIAPVELPCAPGVTGPLCDRSAARSDLERQFGQAAAISDVALRLCDRQLSDFPTEPSTTGSSYCDNKLRGSGEIVDVLGHMHTLGATFRMTLNPGTPQEKILLDIPRWDFSWQLNYQPVEEVRFKSGDVLRIACSWDRSLRSTPDPRYLLFGEGTEDEMCFSTIAVLPDAVGDAPANKQAGVQGTRRPRG